MSDNQYVGKSQDRDKDIKDVMMHHINASFPNNYRETSQLTSTGRNGAVRQIIFRNRVTDSEQRPTSVADRSPNRRDPASRSIQ